MKLSHHTALIAIALAGAALSACSSDDSSPPEPTPAPAPVPAPAPAPDPAPAVEFPVQVDAPTVITLDNGSIFSTQDGLSLYTFDNDEAGVSNCNGVDGDQPGTTTDAESCAGRWPPLLAAEDASANANFALIERADGTQQWAYKDSPLYTFVGDTAQGDVNGDGIGEVFHLARPQPLKLASINDLATYVGNQTIWSATSTAGVLEKFREDKDNFSLYIFDNDPVGDAVCYELGDGGCINNWPPLLADAGAKAKAPLSVLELSNGEYQWAYKGKSLYFFAGDTEAGQSSGDGAGNVWHLATQVPAIQRGDENGTVLTATGMVYALLPNPENSDTLEPAMVNKDQFTLYTFDNDTANVSNCSGDCAVNWPPFLAAEYDVENGAFSKIAREDGSMQWAWQQQPLYFFAGDTEIGQTNGDGLGGVWHIIQPVTEDAAPAVETNISEVASDLGYTLATQGQVLMLLSDDSGDGTVIADKSGFQLYTFANDAVEQSNCTSAGCKANWPALLAAEGETAMAPFSIFTREDGLYQWALNGMPLYFFAGDTEAGQQNGEAIGDVWWVARPAPARVYTDDTEGDILVGTDRVLPSQGKSSEQLNGLSLYTFENDVPDSGQSSCFGGCAEAWPPLYASSTEQAYGQYSIIERQENDGSQTLQWAYKGWPLYFFANDNQPGDTNGISATWPLARP